MTNINIVHVVAIDNQRCIGKDNALAWHIPEDLQHFKNITSGGVIVMGRKTFDSLGRLLPNRSHHVITRGDFRCADVQVWHNLEDAITGAKADAQARGQSSIYIIGGGEIYRQSLPLADSLHITEVDICIDGDAFYPEFTPHFRADSLGAWQTDAKSGIRYRFGHWLNSQTSDSPKE